MPLAEETKIHVETDLKVVNCGPCGGTYAISRRYHDFKYQKGGYWNCPYCKTSWGFGESEIDEKNKELAKKQRELEHMEKRKQWAEQDARNSEYRRRAAVGQLTKTKNRISNGVCPCCNRSFKNLKEHIESKHPDYKGK